MRKFAVIDTETTWRDAVMSIGVVIANAETFASIDQRYYILTPFKHHGGMYSHALYANNIKPNLECSREKAMAALKQLLVEHDIRAMFAYNAAFDHRHLPELTHLAWHDIMKVAAYRQHNPGIPGNAECYATGRLKRGYDVENIYRLLSKNGAYRETHNALTDAMDELMIMKLLNRAPGQYGRI